MGRVYRLAITPEGHRAVRSIKDRKLRREVTRAIDGLQDSAPTQGKALAQELEGFRSLRAVRNRYRILFRVDEPGGRVTVVWVGERRPGSEDDVYVVARRILKTFLT